jgi:hypothetical protein
MRNNLPKNNLQKEKKIRKKQNELQRKKKKSGTRLKSILSSISPAYLSTSQRKNSNSSAPRLEYSELTTVPALKKSKFIKIKMECPKETQRFPLQERKVYKLHWNS